MDSQNVLLYDFLKASYSEVSNQKFSVLLDRLIAEAGLDRTRLRNFADNDPLHVLVRGVSEQGPKEELRLLKALWRLRKGDRDTSELLQQFLFKFEEPRALGEGLDVTTESPFRGLEPYQIEDGWRFFGRDQEIKDVLLRLELEGRVVITGESGSGKSSLAMAGVLARLRRLEQSPPAEKVQFHTAIFRPGPRPWESLKWSLLELWDAIHGASGETRDRSAAREHWKLEIEERVERARTGPVESLWDLLHKLAHGQGVSRQGVALLVDQLEELVSYGLKYDAREHMARMIAHAFSQPWDPRIRLLATLRSDALPELQSIAPWHPQREEPKRHHPGRDDAAFEGVPFYALRPLEPHALFRALQDAAKALNPSPEHEPISRELLSHLLDEAGRAASSLALVNMVLDTLWREQAPTGAGLKLKDYRDRGGIHGVLNGIARRTWERLTKDQQATLLRVLRFVVDFDRLGWKALTRRRVARGALSEAIQRGGEGSDLDLVLETMKDARLMVASERDGEESIELTHDALVQGGSFFAQKLAPALIVDPKAATVGSPLELRSRLRRSLEDWKAEKKDPRFLWNNRRDRLRWIGVYEARRSIDLTREEREFIAASRARMWRGLAGWTGVALLALLAGAASVVAYLAYREADLKYKEASASNAARKRTEAQFEATLVQWLDDSRENADSPGEQQRVADFLERSFDTLVQRSVRDEQEDGVSPARLALRLRLLHSAVELQYTLGRLDRVDALIQGLQEFYRVALDAPRDAGPSDPRRCMLLRGYAVSHESRAEVLQLRGRYADARPAFQEALRLLREGDAARCPGVSQVRRLVTYHHGLLLAESNDLQPAIDAFNEALRTPGAPELDSKLALASAAAHLRLGRAVESHQITAELIQRLAVPSPTPERQVAVPPSLGCAREAVLSDLRPLLGEGRHANRIYAEMLLAESERPVATATHRRLLFHGEVPDSSRRFRVQIDAPLSHNLCFPLCQVDMRSEGPPSGDVGPHERHNSCVPCRVDPTTGAIAGMDAEVFKDDGDGRLEFDTAEDARCMILTTDTGDQPLSVNLRPW